jgi:hypothetical protein
MFILLFLLGEEIGFQQLIATFSKRFVEKFILWIFLGELMDLGKQLLFYCKGDVAHSI